MKLWEILQPRKKTVEDADAQALCACCAEYGIAELAFEICVNTVAAAFGRVDFRTFAGEGEKRREYRGAESYLWNVEPNRNQNSTDFLHELISELYRKNEVLILPVKGSAGADELYVADGFTVRDTPAFAERVYESITVGGKTVSGYRRESEVLHLRLNARNVRGAAAKVADSLERCQDAAERFFRNQRGVKLKVKVSTLESMQKDFRQNLERKVRETLKALSESENAAIPETEGWEYSAFGADGKGASDDIVKLAEQIYNETAQAFLIPFVMTSGKVEATGDAEKRFLSQVIDPLADQLQEEINRKRFGAEAWRGREYLRVDTSAIRHFDMFDNAANVEKLIGSALYSVNDIARAAGAEEIGEDWADRHYLTKNIATVEEAIKAADERR